MPSEVKMLSRFRLARCCGALALLLLSCSALAALPVGVTAGPALVGAAITLLMWVLRQSITAVPLAPVTVRAILEPVPFLVAAVFFTLLYGVVPARRVAWSHALASGVLAAAAFEVLRRGFAWYVAHAPSYEIMYGALAAVPLFLLWIFLFWMIVLAGAAVTASLANDRGES